MKTNKEILTANRALVISELTTAFSFKKVELKVLMTDYLAFLESDEWILFDEIQSAVVFMIKKSVEEFYDIQIENSIYEKNYEAVDSFTEQQRKLAFKSAF